MGMRLPSVMPSTDIRVLLTMPLLRGCETHQSGVSTPWVALLFGRTHEPCFPTCWVALLFVRRTGVASLHRGWHSCLCGRTGRASLHAVAVNVKNAGRTFLYISRSDPSRCFSSGLYSFRPDAFISVDITLLQISHVSWR